MTPIYLLDLFCLIAFTMMTVLCAAAGLSGYRFNRLAVDKYLSLFLGAIFSYGFATIALEARHRLYG
jgi:hypothetical protein